MEPTKGKLIVFLLILIIPKLPYQTAIWSNGESSGGGETILLGLLDYSFLSLMPGLFIAYFVINTVFSYVISSFIVIAVKKRK